MKQFALNLICDVRRTDGTFVPYSRNGGVPSGRVWFVADMSQVDPAWTVVPANRGGAHGEDNPGNPDFTVPLLSNGDQFWVAITDVDPDSVKSVSIAAVFSRRRNQRPDQAAIASPFQVKDEKGVVFDQTLFTATRNAENGFWSLLPATASYPQSSAPVPPQPFEFTIGAAVTYGNGTIRQFALDPEMDVDNYGGGALPGPAES